MNVEIFPSKAKGDVTAPASKSYAHRLLICSALSTGTSEIKNIVLNDDINATIECLKALGAEISLNETTATVTGIKDTKRKEALTLFCNESGSTLRFLIPLSFIFSENTEFTGRGRLMERPQTVFEELFKEKNCFIEKNNEKINVSGSLKGGKFPIRGDVSSQFITGILFTLPLLDEDSEIILTTPLQSEPYINITIDTLKSFGITVDKTQNGYFIKGKQSYKPQTIYCEGDWSSSAFLHAFNLIGGEVCVNGLNDDTHQGDAVYKEYFKLLQNGTPTLDISNCPDLGPVLISCAALLNGATLTGTNRLKIKESDRGEAMAAELSKFGSDITVGDDFIKIKKANLHKPVKTINCHNDHRIAMSMAVVCSVYSGVLEDAQCVNKSYPRFFNDIKDLGITFNSTDNQ